MLIDTATEEQLLKIHRDLVALGVVVSDPENFIADWLEQEDTCNFHAGVPDQTDRPAMIDLIFAARALSGTEYEQAMVLAQAAIEKMIASPRRIANLNQN